MDTQELPFQAEVQQVLHLMVHSLYTNREVFLRELIANASDALDKARYLALTDEALAGRTGAAEIVISIDKSAKSLSIEDNGIGMTRAEAIENLGTIARSGTLDFLKRAQTKDGPKPDARTLIGQFGVGFYSAFIVASRVDVETRSATDPDAEAVLWRSAGSGSFTITESDRTRPGTRVTVHFNKDNEDLLDDWRIEQLIKKYSDFVSHPIRLGDKIVNQSSALWMRPKTEISEEQYAEFYRHVLGGFEDSKPLARMHLSSDAPIQYHALLFIPDKAPYDLLLDTPKKGIRLYAKRMFVMDGCEKLAPPYLRFVRGVVDSEDLSLNVSREVLQDDRTLDQIQKQITKQTLKTIEELADTQPEKYLAFWKEFGRLLRLGASSDRANRDTIAKLLRYPSTRTEGDELVSLETYVGRMPEGQKAVYYLTGSSLPVLRSSPHLEVFRRKGVEVLLMADPVDEWVVGSLDKFGEHPLQSVSHGEVNLSAIAGGEPADASKPEQTDQLARCVEAIQKVLGDKVKQVRVSHRLTESVSCLVNEEGGMSPSMERVMKMLDREVEQPKRILEINPGHPFVRNLAVLVDASPQSDQIATFSELLLDQALLAEGMVPDPAGLLKRMQRVMTLASR
jgi:molecular chaperone HtpG